ncbi:MAG: hypothetical protein SO008_01175 [Bacteroidaceae bacterium]|nr:hypothetical protein [Bacteroidaceae bacterium]
MHRPDEHYICLATTLSTTDDAFEDEANKTLSVSETSLGAYQSATEWKDFGKIEPIQPTGLQTVDKGEVKTAVNNGTLTLSNVSEGEIVGAWGAVRLRAVLFFHCAGLRRAAEERMQRRGGNFALRRTRAPLLTGTLDRI